MKMLGNFQNLDTPIFNEGAGVSVAAAFNNSNTTNNNHIIVNNNNNNKNIQVVKTSDNETSRSGMVQFAAGAGAGSRSCFSYDGLPVVDLDDKLSMALLGSAGTSGGGLPNE